MNCFQRAPCLTTALTALALTSQTRCVFVIVNKMNKLACSILCQLRGPYCQLVSVARLLAWERVVRHYLELRRLIWCLLIYQMCVYMVEALIPTTLWF